MSIIQTIRDKGARISVILIALALVGFILTDYFSGKSRGMFSTGSGDIVGKVNGTPINFQEFNRKLDITSDNFKKQGYPSSGQTTQMALENTWENEITRILLDNEFDKLGVTVSPKELGDILYGPNAPADLKQQFTDAKTGVYNAVQAKQQIDQILKKGTPEQKASFNDYINALIQQRKTEKYLAMVNNSVNIPRWFAEKQNADNSLMAKISFVKEVYSSVSDSAVKVTDKEIEDYISKHKDQFKQTESRTIDYVTFSAAPSSADTLDAVNKLLALKTTFDTTNNMEQFLLSEGVEAAFNYDGYKTGKSVQSPMKDSIFKMPVGSVYGPYVDGANVVLAKLQGVRTMPDSVKIRHILIGTMDRDQNGQAYEKRDSATARTLIRSALSSLMMVAARIREACMRTFIQDKWWAPSTILCSLIQ
jgi:peptidyl-prolyl cis-trans isomerase D